MAESWYEYVYGTPEQDARDWHNNVQQYAKLKASPAYRELRGMEPIEINGRDVDPREVRMAMALDSLVPGNTSDATEDMAYAADYVMNLGSRPRDTAFRAIQEAMKGNYADAAGKAAAVPLSPFMPSMASGTAESEGDWRKYAVGSQAMAIDMLTDPLNYGTLGIRPAVRAIPGLAKRVSALRYGRGAPTFLVDEAGDVIRQLRSSPRAQPMRIEYAPR